LAQDLLRVLRRFGDHLSEIKSTTINGEDGSDHLLSIMVRIFHMLSVRSMYAVNSRYMKDDLRLGSPISASVLSACGYPVATAMSQSHLRQNIEKLSDAVVDQLLWLGHAIQAYFSCWFALEDCQQLFKCTSKGWAVAVNDRLYMTDDTYRNSKVDMLDKLMIELTCSALSDASWSGPKVVRGMLEQREDFRCLQRESHETIEKFKRTYRETRMQHQMIHPSDSCRAVFCNSSDQKWRTESLHASKSWLFLVTFQFPINVSTAPLLIDLCPLKRRYLRVVVDDFLSILSPQEYCCGECVDVMVEDVRVCQRSVIYKINEVFPLRSHKKL
jgi:hypothetical protein